MKRLLAETGRLARIARRLRDARRGSFQRLAPRPPQHRFQRLEQLEERTLLSIGSIEQQERVLADSFIDKGLVSWHQSSGISVADEQVAAVDYTPVSYSSDMAQEVGNELIDSTSYLPPILEPEGILVNSNWTAYSDGSNIPVVERETRSHAPWTLTPDRLLRSGIGDIKVMQPAAQEAGSETVAISSGESGEPAALAGSAVFSATTNPYGYLPATTNDIWGWDDYDTSLSTNVAIDQISVYVNIATLGGELVFDFFDSDLNHVGTRSYTPTSTGDQWIDVDIATALTIPDVGRMSVYAEAPLSGS